MVDFFSLPLLYVIVIVSFVACTTIVPFVIIGGLAIYGLRTRRRPPAATVEWLVTAGTVIESTVVEGGSFMGVGGFMPSVEYEYTVEGVAYRGTVIHVSNPIFEKTLAEAQQRILMYPPRANVEVHYNPFNPADSALEV